MIIEYPAYIAITLQLGATLRKLNCLMNLWIGTQIQGLK
ncbi:hypothetical protein S2091_0734 [Solimicrobium silvestre]|uniref:Uncharacterized protein n=1 Tax=Solimicrobium silvestre TaxID=2099400 RepID=A0A2S9H449_9BURK|nr:hypothetical protein S2091_0734 [Solimicrobium silvestre]